MHDKPHSPKAKQNLFYQLLANTLVVSVVNFTVWFALTFYIYLQTKSVLAMSIISGIYLVVTVLTGMWFGSLVDHHKKRTMMFVSCITSFIFYAISFGLYQTLPPETFTHITNPMLWVFVTTLLLGVIAGNIRGIVMPTLVTILVSEDKRDKANGLVGTASGVSFLVTSVISGILVAKGGMLYVLILALTTMVLSVLHLCSVPSEEKGIVHVEGAPKAERKIDIRGTLKVVRAVPGLLALILFSTFNNFLGGVFMSLMDAYGLSMVSVQSWGFLWGVLSTGFIIGGLVIAKVGLGKNPLRALMLTNIILWTVTIIFPLHASILLLSAGMFVYMCLVPYVEAAEQTIFQKVVPYERQGRVFGFAQSVEQAASPLTAFMIGPIAQFIFIPLMTTGVGATLIGSWFGTGPARGIALVFIVTACIGLIFTIFAFNSKYYKRLSARYQEHKDDAGPEEPKPKLDAVITDGLVQ